MIFCFSIFFWLSLFVAEIGRIILIGAISTLGIIVFILILLAVAYFWWRHKRSQLEFVEPCDENETSSGSLKFQQMLDTQQQEQLLLQQQQQQLQQQQQNAAANPTTNNINRKINGFLNLKTPLIGWVNCIAVAVMQNILSLPLPFFLIAEYLKNNKKKKEKKKEKCCKT